MRCEVCRTKFKQKYFLEKTCSKPCKDIYDAENPKKGINKKSEKRKKEELKYTPVRAKYLQDQSNCERPGCVKKATEIHHKNGREGSRLYDDSFFMAICRECHTYIHENPKESRQKGWLL